MQYLNQCVYGRICLFPKQTIKVLPADSRIAGNLSDVFILRFYYASEGYAKCCPVVIKARLAKSGLQIH